MRIHRSRKHSSSRPRPRANSDRRNTSLLRWPGVKVDCRRLVPFPTRHRVAMNSSNTLAPPPMFPFKASAGHNLRCVTFQVATCSAVSQAQTLLRNRLFKSTSLKVGQVTPARRKMLSMPSRLGVAPSQPPPMVTVPWILLLPELSRCDALLTPHSSSLPPSPGLSFESSIYSVLDLYNTITRLSARGTTLYENIICLTPPSI
ncbi:hypothetical protein M433DRAFT_240413 [Acidomyces richmondensis BFW]|nr:hypothetical protein M433DRAFT_240413 [Acidomyces richmondensis BFW]